MATTSPTKMTMEEFLALPDDGVHRELIRGELREYPHMSTRNPKHAYVAFRVAHELGNWFDAQSEVVGVIVVGDARCQLFPDRETVVGIDVAVFLGEEALRSVEQGRTFENPPVLAVEVLSPNDTHEQIVEKIHLYQEAQTPQTWIVDPDLQTIVVHRPNDNPTFYHRGQSLTGDPELPGFRADVSTFFALRRPQS